MLSVYLGLWLVFGAARASVCPQGRQFLSQDLQMCVDCSVCDVERGHVVLRPCEVHRDTICGPLTDLTPDWRFSSGQKPPSTETRLRHAHHRHHQQHHHAKEKRIYWSFGDDGSTATPHIAAEPRVDHTEQAVVRDITSTEVPFSSTETLIWDWQAVVLTLGVFVCILFFLVIAFYSFHQARQWRRLKENFEADVEELSAQLRLMATVNEKGEMKETCVETIQDPNYLKNRCNYLEHLLNVRKDTKIGPDAGNVYIEEANPKT